MRFSFSVKVSESSVFAQGQTLVQRKKGLIIDNQALFAVIRQAMTESADMPWICPNMS